MFVINRADMSDLDEIVTLYEKYLSFYKVDISNKNPLDYLKERLRNDESIIYFAVTDDNEFAGFTQLYPLYCSLAMQRVWLLYDLYVDEKFRKEGVGQLLLERADQLAEETNSAFIMLSTATDNIKAQHLYEKSGYEKDVDFYTYLKHLTH
ncbi:GNAT family N-acetyltransferase [Enterovibrio nigricans]|uniref:Ribosomal protein S18 acetylase RimI n=1 Tax=Enterovibrio nigricans DSM 22720 TaxID=1121868 RepID=A0A1T4V5X4_9GAMM|nr:GNAT family N-acetyltransferase [Enterovibrio nigricans]PKF50475.1 N-acetyltransferase [Enterovibrio nigricans]SKA59941.1 Ribosomal protein S18 acetylase RimI [Enterovibrio nigricans DSM 22720]